jgi:peptide/nickel transport system permease protein
MSTDAMLAASDETRETDASLAVEPDLAPAKRSWFTRSAPMMIFLGQRLLSALIVLLGATFIVYMLLSYAVDPLEDLRFSQDPNRDMLIAERIQMLRLDLAPPVRYFMWLGSALTGDLGMSAITGQPVSSMLATALPNTIMLVMASTILAILLGVMVGIVSALRQYTRFDYSVTFLSFVLFSLPSFWVAVLAKLYGAIGFNNFLANPHIDWWWLIGIGLIAGVIWSAIIGGVTRTRLITFAGSAAITSLSLVFLTNTEWMRRPSLGYVGVLVIGVATAFGVTAMLAGLQIRKALYASLTAAAVGTVLMYPLQWAFQGHVANWLLMLILALSSIAGGMLIGWFWGGFDRGLSMRIAAMTSFLVGFLIFIDRMLQVWPFYLTLPRVVPISTLGQSTMGISGQPGYDFWVGTVDSITHMILPTITLLLISFAAYTRYARASLLEVMNQDYIRTARAKGLPERVVIMRHAFRNALIPLATIVPLDIAAVVGGTIITEQIFAWRGMGSVVMESLNRMDVNPIMGHFLVVGSLVLVASIVVDLIYAALDPRIRVNA